MSEYVKDDNEAARLGALDWLGIVNGESEPEFAPIAQRAAAACEAPMALVTFVTADKQWIKAAVGVEPKEMDRQVSFCAWAVHSAKVLCVEDAFADERFRDNPLVAQDPHIRFYAGAPIPTPDGYMLGAVCVLDREPRILEPEHRATLEACANEVAELLSRRAGAGVHPALGA